jgi:monoamine oxidase
LLQSGFKVTLIEARDRIGGRIHQEQLPNGLWADMGANWIHGVKGNPFLDLAKETSTAVVSPNDTSFVINGSGHPMPHGEAVNDATVMWDIIEDAFKHSNERSAEIPDDESLWDFFLVKVPEKIPETSQNFQKRRETVLQMSEVWGAYIGSSIQKQSLKFFFLEECIDGGEWNIRSLGCLLIL